MTRVLVVEDDAAIRALLADLLEEEGYVVSKASSGAEGVREFERARPQAIVLDLMLPDTDGRQVAEACYQRCVVAPVPILLMSAAPQPWYLAEQLRRFGVRGFLSKPFDLETFIAAVRDLSASPALAMTG